MRARWFIKLGWGVLCLALSAHGPAAWAAPAAKASSATKASAGRETRRRHDDHTTPSQSARARSGNHDDIPAADPTEPDRQRIEKLQEALRSELGGGPLARLRVGLHVSDARSGRLFYRRSGDALMDPASNQKVLATATAVLRLGNDWHFTTSLEGALPDGDGVMSGPLYLRGDGDPTLSTGDLETLASALVARGITKIDGPILADDRHRAGAEAPTQRPVLLVNHNLVTVRAQPGDTGRPPLLTIEPETASWQIENEAKTVDKGRTRIVVNVTAKAQEGGSRMVVHVSGRIAANSGGVVFRRRVSHAALYSAAVLRGALVRAGIAVTGEAGLGEQPREAHTLAAHGSPPLAVLLRRVNKDSDNDQAERVLDALGANWSTEAPTTAAGLAALRAALADLGVP